MPIDLIISPELEVAKSIERQLKAPGAYDVVPFLDDEIELLFTNHRYLSVIRYKFKKYS